MQTYVQQEFSTVYFWNIGFNGQKCFKKSFPSHFAHRAALISDSAAT